MDDGSSFICKFGAPQTKKLKKYTFSHPIRNIRILVLLSFISFLSITVKAKAISVVTADSPIEGRWDLKLYGKETYPSWLEVSHSGNNMLIGQFVAIVGSARPISKVNYTDGKV